MGATSGLLIALYATLTALAGVGIWALFVLVRTAEATRSLVRHLDAGLPPLIAKASATLDTVNVEMVRVDGLVTQLEEVSDKVTSTTRAASEIVGAPAAAVAGLSQRARRFFSVLTGRRL